VVAALVTGMAAGALNPVLSAVEYERIPEHLQSRVFGVTAAGCLAGIPVGILLAGVAAESLGLRTTLLITAGIYLLATLSPLVWPVWREMDAGRGSTPVEAGGADRVEGHQHDALEPGALPVEDDEDGDQDRQREHAYQQR
jgi:MFS family permease